MPARPASPWYKRDVLHPFVGLRGCMAWTTMARRTTAPFKLPFFLFGRRRCTGASCLPQASTCRLGLRLRATETHRCVENSDVSTVSRCPNTETKLWGARSGSNKRHSAIQPQMALFLEGEHSDCDERHDITIPSGKRNTGRGFAGRPRPRSRRTTRGKGRRHGQGSDGGPEGAEGDGNLQPP